MQHGDKAPKCECSVTISPAAQALLLYSKTNPNSACAMFGGEKRQKKFETKWHA